MRILLEEMNTNKKETWEYEPSLSEHENIEEIFINDFINDTHTRFLIPTYNENRVIRSIFGFGTNDKFFRIRTIICSTGILFSDGKYTNGDMWVSSTVKEIIKKLTIKLKENGYEL